MLKKVKFKNSVLLFVGILFVFIGCYIGFLDYFKEKKEKIFAEMNILLYENEIPENVESEEIIQENTERIEQESPIESKEDSNKNNEDNKSSDKSKSTQYDYIGILEIPKINLRRGFLNQDSKYNNVNYNVTLIGGSTLPDKENNNLILAAHSGVCSVCFFDKLFNLNIDDSAYIYYNKVKYHYRLKNTYEVEKTGKVAIHRDYEKNTLTLITCTHYSNTKQTVFIFELDSKENY